MLKTEIRSPGRTGKHSELHSDLSSPSMAAPKTSSTAHGNEGLLESKALWDWVARSERDGCCKGVGLVRWPFPVVIKHCKNETIGSDN